jgi:hypothetical protein
VHKYANDIKCFGQRKDADHPLYKHVQPVRHSFEGLN